jgi:hypothetical protein
MPRERRLGLAGLGVAVVTLLSASPPSPAQPVKELRWEYLPSNTVALQRAKVPGGWLVAIEQPSARGPASHPSLTFYPDPEHTWDGGSVH